MSIYHYISFTGETKFFLIEEWVAEEVQANIPKHKSYPIYEILSGRTITYDTGAVDRILKNGTRLD